MALHAVAGGRAAVCPYSGQNRALLRQCHLCESVIVMLRPVGMDGTCHPVVDEAQKDENVFVAYARAIAR